MTLSENHSTAVEIAFRKIRDRSLFAMVPAIHTDRLLREAAIIHVRTGTRVPRTEKPDTIWIVVTGKVDLLIPELAEGTIEDSVLGGRSIELKTLFLRENQWKWDWRAAEDSELLAIKFADFRSALAEDPAVEDYLTKITCFPELHRFKNDLRFFGVPNSQLPQTLQGMQRYIHGSTLPDRLRNEEGIYIVARGQISARRADRLHEFGVGDYFPWNPKIGGSELISEADGVVWWMALGDWKENAPTIPVPEIARLIDAFAHGVEISPPTAPEPSGEPEPGPALNERAVSLPTEAVPESTGPNQSSSRALVYFRLFIHSKRLLVEILCLAALGQLFGLTVPLYTKYTFDAVGGGGNFSRITWTAGLAVLSTGMLSFMYISYHKLGNHLRGVIEAKFAPLFLGHVYRMPLQFFGDRQVGDITSRLGDLVFVRDAFVGSLSRLIEFAFLVVINLLALSTFSFWISLTVVGIASVMTLVMLVLFRTLSKRRREFQDAIGKSHSLVFEQFSALETLRTLGGLVAARWRWEYARLDVLRLQADTQFLQAFIGGLAEFFGEITVVLCLLVGVFLHLNGQLSIGQLVAVNALVIAVVSPITMMVEAWRSVGQVSTSIRRIDEVMSLRPEENGYGDPATLPNHLNGTIQLDRLVFRYNPEDRRPTLDGISLEIRGGQTVAFVGHSGSGKSTLAYMLSRLRRAESGSIRIDGRDIDEYPVSYLRARIGLVIQENSVFSGSILENIAGGARVPSSTQAMRAAQLAGAHGFISRLPMGYSTELGEGGSGLSSGQRQKLNIARALYRDPDVLILDEATSSLDGASEDVIMDNLQYPGKKRTTIIIAHRLNTVIHADRIFVMERGRLIEAGTHDELLTLEGKYSELYRSQRN